VSVKSTKYGSPIGLGDILRQRKISEPFLMIVGFWRQRTYAEKWVEDIGVAFFNPNQWNELWGNLTLQSIQEIDSQIKDLGIPYSDARLLARNWKRLATKDSCSKIVVNPKIDSKTQRRIQCSLPFRVFWEAVGRQATISDSTNLFDFLFNNPIISSPRTFNPD